MRTLTGTTSKAIADALQAERRDSGAVTFGLVLTLIAVVTSDRPDAGDAVAIAACRAGMTHPCRVIVVQPGDADAPARLDAEVSVGGEWGPGELVRLHLAGAALEHADTVVLPLLAPDTPVVTWWAGPPPAKPADEPLGLLASRRITDTYLADDPRASLLERAAQYQPGDTDLAWTRDTLWRSMIASVYDALPGPTRSLRLTTEHGNPSAALLAAWLQRRTGRDVDIVDGPGPAITEIEVVAAAEPDGTGRDVVAVLVRPDGATATLQRTDQPNRVLPLPIRPIEDLLAEELQRLDPDPVYAEALLTVGSVSEGRTA